ncbi:MAG: proteasome accessory factor PafA2 family protein, partial [bacterium]|nr:proteasome accessory factor PafA2 family protein [bacterium]
MLMGVESEYAIAGPTSSENLSTLLLDQVRQSVRCLRGEAPKDLFLQNGARFYVDSGNHPEMTTPECSSPAEVIRYILAGERILWEAVSTHARHAMIFKCNVNYGGAKTTWGSHESYLHRSSPASFPDLLVPHNVSRVIYSGAGGFNPFSAGIEFTLSPRAWHLRRVLSGDSTSNRGIFHTKNEPLSRAETHRLHLICGESLCSETSNLLRIGTTAIVVGLIDGARMTAVPRLAAPLDALRRFVSDPACRATARLTDGKRASAIDIQRFYLGQAEENLSVLPSWAESVVRLWRGVLDSLEDDPLSLCTTLDWTIKWPIYRERIAAAGFDPPQLPRWNDVANTVTAAIKKSDKKGLRVEQIVDLEHSPIPDTIRKLTPFMEEHGLSWNTLRPFIDLQKSLFEMDMRFGQIGNGGVFNRLDRAGVLSHHVPEVAGVEAATT